MEEESESINQRLSMMNLSSASKSFKEKTGARHKQDQGFLLAIELLNHKTKRPNMERFCQVLRQAGTAIFTLLLCMALRTSAQAQQISISRKPTDLKEIFRQVEKQTKLIFLYTRTKTTINKTIKLNKKNYSLSELIQELELSANLHIRISGNNVIVKELATGTLKGQIRDEKGDAISFATLGVAGKIIQADEMGSFTIHDLPEGNLCSVLPA